jgi:hypothetical protein
LNTVALKSTPQVRAPDTREAQADASSWSCKTPGCDVRVFANSQLIDPEIWRNAFSAEGKDHRYYEIVEETLYGQFDQKYFVIRNGQTGRVAVQPFFFVDQDLLAGLPARLRRAAASLRKYWPRFLNLRMMMVGCAEGDGQLDCAEPWAVEALHDAVNLYARHEKAAIILLKAFPAKHRAALSRFSSDDYSRVPSMPGGRMEIDFGSFEEFMQKKLSRIFRKNLRRKFKKSGGLGITMEVSNNVESCVDEVYALYLQTYDRSEFKFEKLTREFLLALGRRMPDRARFFIWRQEGRIIAFALCMVHDGVIYDMNVGMDYTVAFDLHLYFLTLRDIIEWAARNGFKHYYTGPLNYDPKLHMRLDLDPLDIYARHASDFINPVFKIALKYLQPARHDKYIRQFRNADEIY